MEVLSNYRIEANDVPRSVSKSRLYFAEDRRTGRRVTIGFLPESVASDRQVLEAVQAQMRLAHPALPRFYEVGETKEGTPYVVMEDLHDFIPASEVTIAMPIGLTLDIAIRLADLLSAAAQQNLLHGDINPSNVLLGPSGEVKVIDFGSAHPGIGAGFNEMGAMGAVVNEFGAYKLAPTLSPYLAPELLDFGTRDQRSEIFSFGATLYRLLAGRSPEVGSNYQLERGLMTTAQRDPLARNLREIIMKSLRSDPDERYQSFDEIVHQLRSILSPTPEQAANAPVRSAASFAIPMRPAIFSAEGLQSLFADGRKAFASAAFLVSSLIAIIGLVSYSGTRVGFAMAFGGALLAYESVLLFSALFRDR